MYTMMKAARTVVVVGGGAVGVEIASEIVDTEEITAKVVLVNSQDR